MLCLCLCVFLSLCLAHLWKNIISKFMHKKKEQCEVNLKTTESLGVKRACFRQGARQAGKQAKQWETGISCLLILLSFPPIHGNFHSKGEQRAESGTNGSFKSVETTVCPSLPNPFFSLPSSCSSSLLLYLLITNKRHSRYRDRWSFLGKGGAEAMRGLE